MRISIVLTSILIASVVHICSGQSNISGKIIHAENSIPIENAIIKVGDSDEGTISDSQGKFTVTVKKWPCYLVISHIGFKSIKWQATTPPKSEITISMQDEESELDEVVISTGYQQIPHERITGSFSHVNRQLFERRNSSDILSRLEDVTPGLVFNRRHGTNNISIRGRNTINGDGKPLIILDNFPFEGDLAAINPNDVEHVTVLRDAAASSIWGARAGNGVIVITTRKGSYRKEPQITFNTNITIAEKPDLFYQPKMSSSDYIDWEQQLFQKGYYNSYLNNANKVAFSPVVDLLFQQEKGLISNEDVLRQINIFKSSDLRKDIQQMLYQKGVNSQYSIALTGGSADQKYALSAGYDRTLPSSIGDKKVRITLSANHNYRLINRKMEINTAIYYTAQQHEQNSLDELTYTGVRSVEPLYPYARLIDENGLPQVTVKNHRLTFARQAEESGLLDWTYSPLQELANSDNKTSGLELRLRGALSYQFFSFLKAEISYLYQNSSSANRNHLSLNTYYTRDLINKFTQVTSGQKLSFPIPRGSILDRSTSTIAGHSARAQLNVSKKIAIGNLDAILGSELRNHNTERSSGRLYGYDDDYATFEQVDYVNTYSSFVNPGQRLQIPSNSSLNYLVDRYISYYSNAGYSIKNRYIISASSRLDRSNLFGAKSNQKGVPLWSTGLAWLVSSEKFMNMVPLSYLRLRLTYGASGNVNKTISANTTASFSAVDYLSTLPFATILNPPNPALKWERVKMLNIGLDFESRSGNSGGSIEYYRKRGLDLFGQVPFAPSTGISTFNGNTSATKGYGIDLSLRLNVSQRKLFWDVNSIFSFNKDWITDFKAEYPASNFVLSDELRGLPLVGKPQYALYTYPFAGLDPKNGDPLGYLDGKISNDWGNIRRSATLENIQYHGPARPTFYGAFRNNIKWKAISVSINTSYRLGYYFRRSSVNYASLWLGSHAHGDYENRWKVPGDEIHTSVPSNPGVLNSDRSAFYLFSSALIENGNHIRLQDIQLSYDLSLAKLGSLHARNIRFYAYANNLGIIWKATKTKLDPDYPTSNYPPEKSITLGLRFNL